MSKSGIYRAKDTGFVATKTGEVHIQRGVTLVREGHWLLRVAPALFEPIDDALLPDVEQATAGPGEKRGAKA